MVVLESRNFTSKVLLPLQVALSGLGVMASEHPSSSPVSVLDDGVQDGFIPPNFLKFGVGRDFLALLKESTGDAPGNVFYHLVYTLRGGSVEVDMFHGVFNISGPSLIKQSWTTLGQWWYPYHCPSEGRRLAHLLVKPA